METTAPFRYWTWWSDTCIWEVMHHSQLSGVSSLRPPITWTRKKTWVVYLMSRNRVQSINDVSWFNINRTWKFVLSNSSTSVILTHYSDRLVYRGREYQCPGTNQRYCPKIWGNSPEEFEHAVDWTSHNEETATRIAHLKTNNNIILHTIVCVHAVRGCVLGLV